MPHRVPFDVASTRKTLFDALLDARAAQGAGREIVEDPDRTPMTYDRVVLAASVLGRKLAVETQPREPVGVLLPNVAGFVAVFFALQATGRVVAMLNFTAGLRNLKSALATGEIAASSRPPSSTRWWPAWPSGRAWSIWRISAPVSAWWTRSPGPSPRNSRG
jgi:acyl-[acyl-carrier-protein]-phospholipid O-acyltransferase / long-chain-fatty-acid--[acyl-carrier-protein] ligase